ncbi:MAG: hypothetical protein GX073_07215 [Firmicutes bacterium]|nr:hypothetical protein [Bacillota bacterium]
MNELANTLRWAGVVGAGGAGFPTYVKVSGKAECLIANGAECEPMIGKDQVIMTNHSALLVEGMRLVMAATGANKGIIGEKVARSACTSCAHCSETCPRRLLGHPVRPHLVMRAASYYFPGDLTVPPAVETLLDTVEEARYCVECGLCEIVCPMGLSPRTINGYVKKLLPKKPGPANYVPTPLSTRPGLLMPTSRVYQKLGISEFAACQPAVDEKAPPVNKVRLFLKQGIGMPAVPVVKAGQEVKKGELLAEPPNDQLGVALHSSINGRISQITTEEIVVEESRGTA